MKEVVDWIATTPNLTYAHLGKEVYSVGYRITNLLGAPNPEKTVLIISEIQKEGRRLYLSYDPTTGVVSQGETSLSLIMEIRTKLGDYAGYQ